MYSSKQLPRNPAAPTYQPFHRRSADDPTRCCGLSGVIQLVSRGSALDRGRCDIYPPRRSERDSGWIPCLGIWGFHAAVWWKRTIEYLLWVSLTRGRYEVMKVVRQEFGPLKGDLLYEKCLSLCGWNALELSAEYHLCSRFSDCVVTRASADLVHLCWPAS